MIESRVIRPDFVDVLLPSFLGCGAFGGAVDSVGLAVAGERHVLGGMAGQPAGVDGQRPYVDRVSV
jgi:hypothetical protein